MNAFSIKKADYVIVTNSFVAKKIETIGGASLILPDKIPMIAKEKMPEAFNQNKKPLITLISSFAEDEPIEEVLRAVKKLDDKVTLIVTGSIAKAKNLVSEYQSEHIIFSDYLEQSDYDGLISNSDFLIDLTTDDETLVCGAYEGLSVRVPVLLSNSSINKEVFRKGFVYSDNNSEGIQSAIEYSLENKSKLSTEIKEYKSEFKEDWEEYFNEILRELGIDH